MGGHDSAGRIETCSNANRRNDQVASGDLETIVVRVDSECVMGNRTPERSERGLLPELTTKGGCI